MKITKPILSFGAAALMALSLGACEKKSPDTAVPGDVPSTDEAMPDETPVDEALPGDEEVPEGEEAPAEGEGDAEAPTP